VILFFEKGAAVESNGKPLFPTHRFSRIVEKNTLVGLNNRLASIIDRNRQLENENLHLGAEVNKIIHGLIYPRVA